MTLLGLLFWAVVVAFFALVGIRAVPTVIEYYTIQKAVDRIAATNPATVPAVRQEFDRFVQVEYSIQSIRGADLEVTKENDRVVISFAYDKEVPIAGSVYLLIKYEGRSR